MRNFAIFLKLLCSLFTGIGAIDEDANFALAGYLPDYRLRDYIYRQMPGKKIDSRSRPPMTDLILFSLQPHARGFFGCCLQEDHYNLVEEYLNSTMQMQFLAPTIRVWITLGGGGRTEAFPEICANSRLRQRLIGSVINLSSRYSFIGGIDLDFFQPRTIEERDNYIAFLTEAIPQWHHQGLAVSLTLHPRQGRMIPPSVYELLDRIHFMTYDMAHDINNRDGSKYHASIIKVRHAVEELLADAKGLERNKVLLGIPAYARQTHNPSQVKTFSEIYDDIRIEHESNQNPSKDVREFLLGDTEGDLHSWSGYEWESPKRIRAKVDLAKDLNLGGVFFWEIGQDKGIDEHPRGILLETAMAAVYEIFPTLLETSKSQRDTEL